MTDACRAAIMGAVRVAYTLEQCWHDAPGGTAVAAIEVARRLAPRDDVTLVGVAGRHRAAPDAAWRPPIPVAQLPLPRPLLYEAWLRLRRPRVERVTGPRRVAHATGLVPCPSAAPLVVTMHDLAFVHQPDQFTRQGLRVMRRSLAVTRDDGDARRHVQRRQPPRPRGQRRRGRPHPRRPARRRPRARGRPAPSPRSASRYALPERFVLFVGTLEPRKNLRRLGAAMARLAEPLPLVVAGPDGWGEATDGMDRADVRFLGFVPASRPARAVRRGDGVRLPERARGVRAAGRRGDGPGHAGRHERRHVDRGGRRRRGRARRPVRRRRHRRRHRRAPSAAPTSWPPPGGPGPPS